MEMCPNASQIFDIYLFIYSFQDMTSTLSNNNLLCILIGKVLINDSLILHYHKNKKNKRKKENIYYLNFINKITLIMKKYIICSHENVKAIYNTQHIIK